MDTTSLIALVSRMEMLGTKPKDIYAELAKTIDPYLAWQVVHEVTGWAKRCPKSAKPRLRFGPLACVNMSLGQIGKHHSPQTCEKIAKALTGRTRSQETRDRIAAGRTKYWAARRARNDT